MVPYKLIGAFVLAFIFIGLGWELRDGKAQEERAEAVTRAIEQANNQHRIDTEIIEGSVEIQKEIEVRYVTIEKEVDRIVFKCDDNPDWLRLYNRAIEATGSTTTSP